MLHVKKNKQIYIKHRQKVHFLKTYKLSINENLINLCLRKKHLLVIDFEIN